MNSFLYALVLMTRLPVGRLYWAAPSASHWRRSIYYYPLVGAVLALLLMLVNHFTSSIADDFVRASILVLTWVLLTGALHLDGLADSWDAYFAHHGNAARTMQIMKDPTNGTLAVVAIVLCILLKVACLTYLILAVENENLVFLVTLAISRALVLLLMLYTPYAPFDTGASQSIAARLSAEQSTGITFAVVLASITFMLFVMENSMVLTSVLACVLLLVWWRQVWIKMIGGYTGDVLGAYIEMAECTILLTICYIIG